MFVVPGDLADEVNELLDVKLYDVQNLTDQVPDYTELDFLSYSRNRSVLAKGCILSAHPVPFVSAESFARAEIVINGQSYSVMSVGSPPWEPNKPSVVPSVPSRYQQLVPREVPHVRSTEEVIA